MSQRRFSLSITLSWHKGRRGFPLTLAAWFVALAVGAAAMDTFPGDVAIMRAVQGVHVWGATALMRAVSALGGVWVSVVTFAIGVAGLWALRRRPESLLLLSAAVPDMLTRAAKIAVARIRPSGDLVQVFVSSSGPGFPSGHVVHAVVFYGVLFYLTLRLMPRGAARTALLVLWGAVIILMGLSRVYRGAHWPSDVLGGYVFGALSLGLMIMGYEWYVTRREAMRPAMNAEGVVKRPHA